MSSNASVALLRGILQIVVGGYLSEDTWVLYQLLSLHTRVSFTILPPLFSISVSLPKPTERITQSMQWPKNDWSHMLFLLMQKIETLSNTFLSYQTSFAPYQIEHRG